MTTPNTGHTSPFEQISGPEAAQFELDSFAHNVGLESLARLFGAPELPVGDTAGRLTILKAVADQHWSFRPGVERQQVDWSDELLDDPESQEYKTIFQAADMLDMVRSTEPVNTYPDILAILGGANHAPLDRLNYALEQVEGFGVLLYLGSSRPVGDGERVQAADYAPEARTESELGVGAFMTLPNARIIDNDQSRETDNGFTEIAFEWRDESKSAFVLNTPLTLHQGEQKPRATTHDNWQLFARSAELSKKPDQSVVAVTTGFYVPAQRLAAIQELTLGYGVEVEVVGHDAAYGKKTRTPKQLLQESKAAVDAAIRLQKALSI